MLVARAAASAVLPWDRNAREPRVEDPPLPHLAEVRVRSLFHRIGLGRGPAAFELVGVHPAQRRVRVEPGPGLGPELGVLRRVRLYCSAPAPLLRFAHSLRSLRAAPLGCRLAAPARAGLTLPFDRVGRGADHPHREVLRATTVGLPQTDRRAVDLVLARFT